jgi:predicted Zn-dependent peptidase
VNPLSVEVQQRTLSNGLEVAVTPLPHLHTVTIVAGVRVGARHESARDNGISHFLEHMLFRGTAQHPTAHAFNLAVEELGGTLQAATRADFTTYDLTLPPEHAPQGIALLAEIFEHPALLHPELEKRIVREEILEGLDEDGRDIDADDLAHRALFGTHPLGFKIAGTEANLARFDDAALRAWHARHYVARNMAIGIAGAITPEHLSPVLESCFGGLRPGERQVAAPLSKAMRGPRLSHVDAPESQTDVRLVMPGVGEGHPLLDATELLARVLDDGMSTRLFRTVVEDLGLAYETFGGFDAYEDVGVFEVGASVEHGKTAALVRTVLDLLVGLRDGPIEAREFEKARTRALFDLRASVDRDAQLAELLVFQSLFDRPLGVTDLVRRIESVRPEDLSEAARATVRADHLQVVAVGTLSEGLERETRRMLHAFR